MNKLYKTILSLSLLFSPFMGKAQQNNFFEIAKQIEIFTTLFKEINTNYVDDTNPAQLMDAAIKKLLDDLDPYTKFYNEQDVEQARYNQANDNTGIGAKVLLQKDKLIIIEPYKDYAADRAGLKAGDEIVKVNEVSVADFNDDASNLLQGTPGSEVKLTYKRQNKENTAVLKRTALPIKAVPFYEMIGNDTGYVVLSSFTKTASSEVLSAIQTLKDEGATKFILDLRGNLGGLLNEAVKIVNFFVPKGQLVVNTKSKIKKYNTTYITKKDPVDLDLPLVVLINGRSASASEIVSGALQDLDRAVVIGSRSFGKGLVQRPKPLLYGTQMKITISRYYTPSGRCIQALDYWNRDENGKATRVKQENANAFKTKNGRTVYDGGGITPDIDMSISKLDPIVKAIEDENLIFNYATDFYYKHPKFDSTSFQFSESDFKNFKSYLKQNNFNFKTKTEQAITKALNIDGEKELVESIQNEYEILKKSIENFKDKSIDDNKEELINLLTDEIIKRYVYIEGVYQHKITNDQVIKKAIKILSSPVEYQKILQ